MTMGHHQHSATILPFRTGPKTSAQGPSRIGKTDAETKGQRLPPVAVYDSWYHQAAIEEASRTRKP